MTVELRTDVGVELIKHDVSDVDVARAAWVSTKGGDAREADTGRVPGLINYLMRNRHGSVWEHGSLTFFIDCPIFVAREFHRHRAGWSYNEVSGRYSVLKPVFYTPGADRSLVQTGKPGHYEFTPGDEFQSTLVNRHILYMATHAWTAYTEMLNEGVAKEVARMVLPLNIFTQFYATCNPRSLMHFLSLRTERSDAVFQSHPQKEIQMVADKMETAFKELMPATHDAFEQNGRVSP